MIDLPSYCDFLISVTTTSSRIDLTTPDNPRAISSPNYPENYPNNNFIITFTIVAPLGSYVELTFLDLALSPFCLRPLNDLWR